MDRKKKTLLSPLLKRTLEMLEGQRSIRTLENYHSSINKVKEFVGDGWEHLTVEDITRGWTDRFTTWLESRHADKPQTVDFYLRTFRALYSHSLALSSYERDTRQGSPECMEKRKTGRKTNPVSFSHPNTVSYCICRTVRKCKGTGKKA